MQKLVLLRVTLDFWSWLYAWSTMSSSSMDEAVRVRNWPIITNYSSYIRLWLVNFLLLQPYPYCYYLL